MNRRQAIIGTAAAGLGALVGVPTVGAERVGRFTVTVTDNVFHGRLSLPDGESVELPDDPGYRYVALEQPIGRAKIKPVRGNRCEVNITAVMDGDWVEPFREFAHLARLTRIEIG